jgi:hypothetical protein
MIKIIDLIAGIFKPAAELIDELHTSEEERLAAKTKLLEVQAAAMQTAFDYESGILESRAKIVYAEASSNHWLTANWRPITMLTFLALAVSDSLGWMPNPLRDEAWTLLQVGIGGYLVGRSGEKIVKTMKQ